MASDEGDTGGMMEIPAEDSSRPEEHLYDSDMNHQSKDGSNINLVMENGLSDGNERSADTYDQLLQMVVDLKFQNEFLKSQFEGFSNVNSVSSESSIQKGAGGVEDGESDIVKELRERIESLNKEFLEEKQTRIASEEALKHLQVAYSDAEVKAKDLSEQLVEAQNKSEREIKDWEEKYSELEAKLNRLHKRAKQRIQEVQKEKDDLEARFSEENESAERASSQELERTRKQANEALKAMDNDRQQLRSANNKLRDTIEELRRSLQPKENALEALQLSLAEKEQMLEDTRGLLQASDEKRQAALTELSAKHQKNIESLEAQLNDALSDRSKADETISSLQVLVAEKESRIAEMEAASTGEVARLRAAMESVKGEISHLKQEHGKEREAWEAASQALKAKLQIAESNCIHAEVEVAKIRSQLESEVSAQAKILTMRDAELLAAKEEISSLVRDFSSYKARAHALLQKKDADLVAAKDSEQLKALEEALKEAENEVLSITEERDRVLQDLQSAMANNEKELAERDTALESVKQQIRSLEIKLDSVSAQHLKEKEEWGLSLQNVEETWRIRCEAMKTENEVAAAEGMQKELEDLKQRCKKLREEHASFHDLSDRMIEDKDNEISRLLDENKNLRQSLQSRQRASQNDHYNTASHQLDSSNLSPSDAEHQILILARQQAQREEELAQSQRHILALQEEIEELEHENRLHSQQEAMLKSELRSMERAKKREGVDMTYLKNIILKLLETGEVEVLLPVIGMLLQFSPEEMQKCQQTYQNSTDVPPSPASETSGSGLSLFSRFSFS
ncbi:protein GRIP [Lathyrus oleraceus]|uniref:GRIP domain-containing protein n=1 Tax=Pisum sativum TaxID=3888 RepID=A0A9D4YHU9_PEA|nr:protein GRIP [Pisum sativum]KAI5438618.1 hypothetical protein KIW84_024379 [Pisum sativum]